jgi:hypothetical protein
MRNVYNILVRKPEGKRSLLRPGHGWEGNIRMHLRKIGWLGVDLYLTQGRDQCQALMNVVMKFWFCEGREYRD